MAKQLLIYENAIPLNSQRHAQLSVRAGQGYRFASDINSVPLMAVEFPDMAGELPVVFAGKGADVMPAVLVGIRTDENLLVDADGKWLGTYVPAFLRRYPFVFSAPKDGSTFTLCIDENFEGVNRNGEGERLFDDAGKQTPYLTNVLGFVRAYQAQYEQTRTFVRRLNQLSLLEPMRATFTLKDGRKFALSGFETINRDRLKALPGETVQELFTTGQLELIYLHLQSLRNLQPLMARAADAPALVTAS